MEPALDEEPTSLRSGVCRPTYAQLYDQFGPALYRAARTMLRSGAEAEDAVQDVFVNLVRSAQPLGRVENMGAYLFTILRHVVGRRLAQRETERRGMRLLAESPPDQSTNGPSSGPGDEQLERALLSLPDPQRQVIALKIDGGLTFAQIATVLGISLNTAASRYRYALEKLRIALGESKP